MDAVIRWWHLRILHHTPERRLFLAASVVVTCQCGSRWVELRPR